MCTRVVDSCVSRGCRRPIVRQQEAGPKVWVLTVILAVLLGTGTALLSAAHRNHHPVNHHLATVGWVLIFAGIGLSILSTIVASLIQHRRKE